ncbi:MAG: hypothetical protein HGA85_05925 [Nanoarchaeota archaeon]|nr:hypothetical protein [Nanoarchaeota archaeon]
MKKEFLLILLILVSSCTTEQSNFVRTDRVPGGGWCCYQYLDSINDTDFKTELISQSKDTPVCCDYAEDREDCLACYNSKPQGNIGVRYTPSPLDLALFIMLLLSLFLTPLLWLVSLIITVIHLVKRVISKRVIIGFWAASIAMLVLTVLLILSRGI